VIDLSLPDIGKEEIKLISKVIKSKSLVDGYYQSKTEELIKKILKVKYVALTQSCSSALEIASILINLNKNDEVLLPSFTFTSTANCIVMRGAKPVFVDINKQNLNMDIQDLEKKITKKTKAVFLVHYGGFSLDMEKLINLKKKYKFYIIEDAAHAFLSKYNKRYLGTYGDIATFSFHATKNLVGSQCGALVINNNNLTQKADVVLDKGTDRKKFIKYKLKKLNTSITKKRYYTWQNIGSEYRATELSSAMLYCQLKKRNIIQKKRKNIWNYYYDSLNKIKNKNISLFENKNKKIQPSYHMFALILKNKYISVKLIEYLQKNKIFATFHYIPLHISPFGKKINKNLKLPITENIFEKIVRIPLHSGLKKKQTKYIIRKISDFFKKK